MEELPSKIKLTRCGGQSASTSNISSNSEQLTKNAIMMDKLQNAVQEQVARFRPPFTPSNSLLPASPPIIRVTPAIPQIFEYSSKEVNQSKINSQKVEEEEKVEELQQEEDDTSTNLNNKTETPNQQQQQTQSTISTQTEMPRPRPQPFPFIASRRRASTASHNALPSSYSFNFGSNLPGNRHSLPRLSITSLGSVAKTFSGLAAFIVPEEQSDKERFRELRIASQRRASLAISRGKNGGTPTTINDNSSKDSSRNSIKHNEDDEDKTSSECSDKSRMPNLYRESKTIHSTTSKMRSSSAKPIPRSQPFNNNNNNNSAIPNTRHNPSQNGKLIQQNNNRDISRNRSSTLTKQNGTGNASNGVAINRAPSMPPRIINRRYAHIKSKVNSITDHSPTPSEVKIFHEPLKVVASPKVGSLVNADHTPLGGNVRILQRKLNFRETARPRVDAKSEIIIPKSEKRIPTEKLVWKAEAKVGSLINAGHQPGGGQNKIFNEPVKVKANSKVGSLDNITHVPGGGNVKISDYARSISGTGSMRSRRNTGSSELAAQSPSTLNADIDSLGGDSSEINN